MEEQGLWSDMKAGPQCPRFGVWTQQLDLSSRALSFQPGVPRFFAEAENGAGAAAGIAVSDGAFRALSRWELVPVLAYEVAHIAVANRKEGGYH